MLQLIQLSIEDLGTLIEQRVTKVLAEHSTEPEIMTVKQAADFLKLKPSTIYEMCARQQDKLPHYKIGTSIKFNKSELKKWLEGFRK